MKTITIIFIMSFIIITACVSASEPNTSKLETPSPYSAEQTKPPPSKDPKHFLTATIVPFYTQVPSPTFEGPPAYINIAVDMGAGGSGFSSTIYAQEVYTGRTLGIFMSAGMHTASFLPTSAPLDMAVPAPGTYVFYARLTNDPMDYHYGFTECTVPAECTGGPLVALEVLPGEYYTIKIADRKAVLPGINERGVPVTVPWVIQTP
ncbi:MAG: hypothetical protein H6635_02475 [Anaerolineales bacterium]|nr:hypothetical protein [Anaerolineales bacterium]